MSRGFLEVFSFFGFSRVRRATRKKKLGRGGKKLTFSPVSSFPKPEKNSQGPFCRAFPEARAWVAPQQWSWPINLPVQFFGIFPEGRLTEEAADPSSEAAVPWLREIDHKPFASSVGIGPYSEVAFYHKKSRTLLVTDAVVQVPRTAPLVVEEEALLEAGGPLPAAVAAFSAGPPGSPPPPPPPAAAAQRAALGWKRMALQILFFVPGDLGRPERSFNALAGRMIVSPVLRKLVFGNARSEALGWVDEICRDWPRFGRIVPCHFEAPIKAGPRELRAAFSFLEEEEGGGRGAEQRRRRRRLPGGGRGAPKAMAAAAASALCLEASSLSSPAALRSTGRRRRRSLRPGGHEGSGRAFRVAQDDGRAEQVEEGERRRKREKRERDP